MNHFPIRETLAVVLALATIFAVVVWLAVRAIIATIEDQNRPERPATNEPPRTTQTPR